MFVMNSYRPKCTTEAAPEWEESVADDVMFQETVQHVQWMVLSNDGFCLKISSVVIFNIVSV